MKKPLEIMALYYTGDNRQEAPAARLARCRQQAAKKIPLSLQKPRPIDYSTM